MYKPGSEGAAPDVAGDAELVLVVLGGGDLDLELVERDGVANLQSGVLARPAALVAAVEETVAEESEVSAGDAFPVDLLEFSLLQEVPPGSDELPVTQPALQLQHRLELVLRNININFYFRL